MLQLVDSHPKHRETRLTPAGSALSSVILAQWRWLNWKMVGDPLSASVETNIDRALLEATRIAGESAGCSELASSLKGNCITRHGALDLYCAEYALLQTSWIERYRSLYAPLCVTVRRYGFDAPLPASLAFTHFCKQWLFNYGPLMASIDASHGRIQNYRGEDLSVLCANMI